MSILRAGMISLIYERMMALPLGNVSESGAMSIMGSDVETLAESFHLLIADAWAEVLQLGIATWLLARQLGPACVAPIIIAVGMLAWCLSLIFHTLIVCISIHVYLASYWKLCHKSPEAMAGEH